MKALVTGGAGLIGSHIVDLLLERGDDVVIVDNLEPEVHPSKGTSDNRWPEWSRQQDADRHQRDVRDAADIRLAMKGVDVVFHQAAYGGFSPSARKYSDVNIGGSATVMEEAQRAGVGKVVVASSQAVYGRGLMQCADGFTTASRDPERLRAGLWEPYCQSCDAPAVTPPLRETQYLLPESPYALSKYGEERLALELGSRWSLPVVALRYGLTYGPRQSVWNPYTGICSIFTNRLILGKPPVIYEDGQQLRDFTYVTDVARANVVAAGMDEANGEIFNVGTGVGTPVLDFVKALQAGLWARQALPEEPDGLEFKAGAWRPQDVRHVVTDRTKITETLDWEPRVFLEEGIGRYLDWYLSLDPRPVVDVFDKAEEELIRDGIVVDVV